MLNGNADQNGHQIPELVMVMAEAYRCPGGAEALHALVQRYRKASVCAITAESNQICAVASAMRSHASLPHADDHTLVTLVEEDFRQKDIHAKASDPDEDED